MNTTANKANVATLIAIIVPFLLWIANRFFKANLSPDDMNIINGAVGAVASWIGVWLVPNKGGST